jgi:predicted RNA binding protein YcfA (HicA-like mRNA interferase family)
LERAGFSFVRQKGSHRIYVKGDVGVTLPWHSKDMRIGTLRHIIKQSGLTVEEFSALL